MAKQQNILLVTSSAAREAFSEENKDWPVSFYHNSTLEIKKLISGLKEWGHKKIALIYEQEPFAEMIRKLVLENTNTLTADIGVRVGEADFNTILSKLKTKNPDVLIVFVWDEQAQLALLQQLRIHLPDLQLATVHDGEGWLSNPITKEVLPRLIYSKFIIADKTFSERFKRRFGYEPRLTASNAYDAINSVMAAMNDGNNTAKEIRGYLITKELSTTTFGNFKFAADGSVPSKVTVVDFPDLANY